MNVLRLESSVVECSTGKQLLFVVITWNTYGVIGENRKYFWRWVYRSLLEKINMNLCLLLNGYQVRDVSV